MHAERTSYTPALVSDAAAMVALAEAYGLPLERPQWPTLVARREGKLVGFVISRWYDGRLVVGPVVVAAQVRLKSLVAVRLVEQREAQLKAAHVLYYLTSSAQPGMRRILEAFGMVYQQHADGEAWYLRVLSDKEGA